MNIEKKLAELRTRLESLANQAHAMSQYEWVLLLELATLVDIVRAMDERSRGDHR
jgi:hypothetical protein